MNPATHPPAKLITCILPDDGRDTALIDSLRRDLDIITANTLPCRGIEANFGGVIKDRRKAVVHSVRMVTVVVPPERADAVFEYLFFKAGIDQPDSGMIYQGDLLAATPFLLPDGVADEAGS